MIVLNPHEVITEHNRKSKDTFAIKKIKMGSFLCKSSSQAGLIRGHKRRASRKTEGVTLQIMCASQCMAMDHDPLGS